jgi:hypothetical protein
MSLTRASSVAEFFRDMVTAALRNQSVDTSEMTEYYLVNLLTEFTRGGIVEEPLALKLAQAALESPKERARCLKEVGDTSLYLSGFFTENLERRAIALDYYISLGGSAYASLATLIAMSRASDVFVGVYGELSDKFPRLVDVLNEVSEKSALGSNRGLLRLYERWVHTRSTWLGEQLKARGLAPPRGGSRH